MTDNDSALFAAKGNRQQAVQVNIFTAYLAALKFTSESKIRLGNQDVISQANQVIFSMSCIFYVSSNNSNLWWAWFLALEVGKF